MRTSWRVVVEHLFKMRHEPFGVDRVAMKAAAKMIVNPAMRHFHQRMGDHFQIARALRVMIMAQEQLIDAGIGKFRRLPQTAVIRVVSAGNFRRAVADDRLGRTISLGLRDSAMRCKAAKNLRDALLDIQPAVRDRLASHPSRLLENPACRHDLPAENRCRRKTACDPVSETCVIGQPPRPVSICTAFM